MRQVQHNQISARGDGRWLHEGLNLKCAIPDCARAKRNPLQPYDTKMCNELNCREVLPRSYATGVQAETPQDAKLSAAMNR